MDTCRASPAHQMFSARIACYVRSGLLPQCDPQHLLLADSPFSGLVGQPVLIVYDANSQLAPNPCATRLTTNLGDGLEVKVGRAVQ
jgi:hypothetical protein